MNTINIFFSWQSDISRDFNKNVILNCLTLVKSNIESNDNSIEINILESTSNSSGSPYIITKILENISKVDIFISDVTIINSNTIVGRKTPNPNVLYESGFALHALGLERIIFIINEVYGLINDLPFDIRQNRILTYKCSQKPKILVNDLRVKLEDAVTSIIKNNPIYGYNLAKNASLIDTRDRKLIDIFFKDFNWSTLSVFIDSLPDNIYLELTNFHEYMLVIYNQVDFQINDQNISKHIDDLINNLNIILYKYDSFYHGFNEKFARFMSFPQQLNEARASSAYSEIKVLKQDLYKISSELHKSIIAKYPDFNL